MAKKEKPINKGGRSPAYEKMLKRSSSPYWLGRYSTVEFLLRSYVGQMLTEDKTEEEVISGANELAKIFLGQSKNFPGPSWFSPGKIDVYLANQEGIDSEVPEERVAGAIFNMLADIAALSESMRTVNTRSEQWKFQAVEIIRSYAHKIAGLPEWGYSSKKEDRKESEEVQK